MILENQNYGIIGKPVRYTDAYLQEISDEIVDFRISPVLNSIYLNFNPDDHLAETYGKLPLSSF